MSDRLPWLEYTGQTTPELIACKSTHSIASLSFAFEWGIQAKARRASEADLTAEELLVLAVLALEREVNNGGYFQFFWNSSRRFAPIIVESLLRLGCADAAAITERAIAALRLKSLSVESVSEAIVSENAKRDAILDACDQDFYKLPAIPEQLFSFIEEHQNRIVLSRTDDYPRHPIPQKLSNVSRLYIGLVTWKKDWNPGLEEARQVAEQLARKEGLPATEAEIEGAAVLHVLERSTHAGDLGNAEYLAVRAFELMRDEPMHTVVHRSLVHRLIQTGRVNLADAMTLKYLEYLKACDLSDLRTQNGLLFWVPLLQKKREILPLSVEFFTANFPQVNLNKPLPAQQIVKGRRAPGTGPAH